MAGIDSARISKVARNISAPEANVYYMHHACEYVIFFGLVRRVAAVSQDSSAGTAPRAQRALPALLQPLGSA